jgi:ATP-dependent helicase/nuclease subunit B
MLRSRGDHTIRRFRGLLRGLTYRNSPRAVGNYRRPNDLPGIVWSGSTKEIEAYLRCPFRHFAMYGLRLQTELRPATLERELGDLMHRVVSRVTRRVIASGRPVNSISDDRWSLFVDAAFKLTLRGLAADAEQRTADRLFLLQGARRFVREVVFAHAERWRRGKFVPSGSEIAFDDGGALPALALTVDDVGSIRLHGVIDRVDRCIDNGDWWLVYDYKSTVGPLSREYLIGPSLQLYVYLLAVMNAGRDGAAAERAGILAAPVRPDLGVLDRNYVASAAPTEQRMYLYRPRGSFEKSAVELLDSDVGETQSPVIAVRRKKNSREFDQSQSRDIVPAGHIAERLQQARHTIGVAVRGIAAGRIDIAPLVENRTRACAYCDFQPVCRFDRLLNEARPAATVLPPIRRDAAKEVPAS